MLRKMRSDFKKYSWTLWLVIIAFLIGFSFTDPFRAGKGSETDLFAIGGIKISAEKYYTQVMNSLKYYEGQFNTKISQALIRQLRVPEQELERLINTAILRKEAERMDLTVSDNELSDKIKNYTIVRDVQDKGPTEIYLFRENGEASGRFIGVRNYSALLARNKIKVKDFEKERRQEIIGEKYMGVVTAPLVINEETLREKYRLEKDKVELDFIVLRPDRIKGKIEVKDEELKEYYENHKEDFKTAEKREGNVIALKFDDFKKDVIISNNELFDYYRKNKESFVIPGKTKVSRILLKYDDKNREEIYKKAEQLQQELTPENFAQKAKELSQDDKAKQGGDWGESGWKSFTDQEKTIIEGLEAKGISPPIDTQKGFSIVFVSEKVEQHQDPFNNVKAKIQDNLQSEELNKLVQDKLGKIYNKLKDEKDIKAKAAGLKVKVIETGALTNGDPIKDVDAAGYISRRLFGLKENEVSTPIDLMDGKAIAQLSKIIKPEIEPFENVKDKVRNKVEMVKKIAMLDKDSREISKTLNEFQDEKKIEKYLKDNKLSATNYSYKRGNRLSYLPEKEGLDETIFALKEGSYSSPIKFENQVAIVKVKSKHITVDADFEKDRSDFYNEKLNDLKVNFFASYLSRIKGNYKFDFFNEKLLAEVNEQIMSRFKTQ